jgi:hypothetical protein
MLVAEFESTRPRTPALCAPLLPTTPSEHPQDRPDFRAGDFTNPNFRKTSKLLLFVMRFPPLISKAFGFGKLGACYMRF